MLILIQILIWCIIADGDEEELPPAPPTIPDPIEEVEEEELGDEEKADSEVVRKIESEGAELATELDNEKEGEKLEEESQTTAPEEANEKTKAAAPEESKSNADETNETGATDGDKMEVEQVVEEKVEIESEKSKTEENTSEGESEKENVSAGKGVNSVEESTKDDSFSSAACAVIGSTNALISSLRQEMAARKSLVAPKQIPRQKPKSGKFWKEERSAFR